MTNLKSTTALFMLLLVPCRAFGGISDVASAVVELPLTMVKGLVNLSVEGVDGLARVEEATFNAVVEYPVKGVRGVMDLADEHSQTLWRLASVATLACAFRYVQKTYMKNCPMACKK